MIALAGLGLSWLFANDAQDGPLHFWIGRCRLVTGIWLVAGPLWESGRAVLRAPAR